MTNKKQVSGKINDIKNSISKLIDYFISPQKIINNKLDKNKKFILPEDLPEQESAWPESQIEINWKQEWSVLNEKWNETSRQKSQISAEFLLEQLYDRLMIIAKAYLYKNNENIGTDLISDKSLFRMAIKILSSQKERYQNIRNSINESEQGKVFLVFKYINDNNLPFILFLLKKINIVNHINYISLAMNQITKFPYDAFSDYQELISLNLEHNDLKKLPENFLSASNSIKYINIAGNNIKRLPYNIDKKWSQIQKIFIQNAGPNNRIMEIPVEKQNREIFRKKLYLRPSSDMLAQEWIHYIFINPEV